MHELIGSKKTVLELSSQHFLDEHSTHFDRIMKVADLLDDPSDVKHLSYMYLTLNNLAARLVKSRFSDQSIISAISDHMNLIMLSSYDYEVLQCQ